MMNNIMRITVMTGVSEKCFHLSGGKFSHGGGGS